MVASAGTVIGLPVPIRCEDRGAAAGVGRWALLGSSTAEYWATVLGDRFLGWTWWAR